MKSIVGSVVTLLIFSGAICELSAVRGATDPNLNVTITRISQTTILNWFGSNAVSYQVESSPTLTVWTNSSPVLIGSGTFLSVTNSIPGQSSGFYRVKRLIPDDPWSVNFDPTTGILTIVANELDNIVVVSRNAGGSLLVNNGVVTITGGVPTVANTVLIQIFGRGGNDQLSLDEANGALPKANLFGEAGDDTLIGGSGADVLNGGPGSDTLLGKGGADSLLGGDDNDTITGGDGDDLAQLGAGEDRFIWNPGDDTDVVEGGDGIDTVEVNGGNGAETFTVTANGTRVRFDRIDPAPFFLDIGTCESLVLNANGGNDSLACTGNLAALIQITADGGPGDDTLLGSNGADVLLGGDNNDFIDGNQGNDVVFLGAGDDTFQWDPGDGNDTIEGEAGNDTLLFNGSNVAENIDLSPNGARLRFARNVGNIVLDLSGVETVNFNALGGADIISVGDLSALDVTALNLRLAGQIGGGTGDSQVDTVILNGTPGADDITATQSGADVSVVGLKPIIGIFTGETNDVIAVHALGGNDTVNISGITSLFAPTIDGGAGDDTIIGSARTDFLLGGDNNDTITGRQGDDFAYGGNGDDTFVWNPGDGNDVLEGQIGTDKLLFNGSNSSEIMDASANGSRFRFTRNVANVILDCDDVEKIEVNALGGADAINIGELTGTDVGDILLDLAFPSGSNTGDTQADVVTLSGTQTNDVITVNGTTSNVTVAGLSAVLTIVGMEATNDTLTVNALGGLDAVDASGLIANVMKLTINGGLGADVIFGSQGDDLINGGDGDDLLFGGAGDDTVVWNPGDDNDTFEGQAGTDTLQFNGANVSENIDISANGTRLRFFRNIANVVMDCNDVEIVRFEALGGADVVSVNDLTGTDVTAVSLNLAAVGGGGDLQPDSIIINGTGGDDVATVSQTAGMVTVAGLATLVNITGSEAANDRVTINTLAGDDIVDASALAAGLIALTADGGIDDDVLIGSGGADILLGGDGDDVLLGGPGVDSLDGGAGSNIVIQD